MSKVIPNLGTFLLLIFLSLFVFGLESVNSLNPIKSLAALVTNPISLGIYKTSQNIQRQFYFIFAARFAAQENKAFKEQVEQLLSENANLRRKLLETEAMVDQEHHLDPRTYNLIATRPIGLGRFLKIDKGFLAGIKVGQAVVFKDNYIGRVIQASPKAASVQIITDPDSKLAAFSLGREGKAKGILIGQFGTSNLLDKILHEEQITVGDLVYSEGTEGFLPRGLILGKVTEIMDRQNEVFKQAKVKPVFDIRDLELVFVISE